MDRVEFLPSTAGGKCFSWSLRSRSWSACHQGTPVLFHNTHSAETWPWPYCSIKLKTRQQQHSVVVNVAYSFGTSTFSLAPCFTHTAESSSGPAHTHTRSRSPEVALVFWRDGAEAPPPPSADWGRAVGGAGGVATTGLLGAHLAGAPMRARPM